MVSIGCVPLPHVKGNFYDFFCTSLAMEMSDDEFGWFGTDEGFSPAAFHWAPVHQR